MRLCRPEPFCGIRQIDNYNIDAVQHIMRVKAENTYRRDLIDVEVQIISKVSTAVQNYHKYLQKRREAKKWPAPTPFKPAGSRRDQFRNQEPMPLWKRMGKEKPK